MAMSVPSTRLSRLMSADMTIGRFSVDVSGRACVGLLASVEVAVSEPSAAVVKRKALRTARMMNELVRMTGLAFEQQEEGRNSLRRTIRRRWPGTDQQGAFCVGVLLIRVPPRKSRPPQSC